MRAACVYHHKYRKQLEASLTRLDAAIAKALRSKERPLTHRTARHVQQAFACIRTHIPVLDEHIAQLGDMAAGKLEETLDYSQQQNPQLWERITELEGKIERVLELVENILAMLRRYRRAAIVSAILLSPLALPLDSVWQGTVGDLIQGAAKELFTNLIAMFAK